MSLSPDDESSLTIKYDGTYAAPWLVLKGHPSNVRSQLIQAFGYEEDALEGVTLAELAAKAAIDAAAMYALAGGGATPEPRHKRPAAKPTPPWDEPKAASEGDADTKRVLALIEASTDADELKRAWATNEQSFDGNKALQSAYKAKAKLLKSATTEDGNN